MIFSRLRTLQRKKIQYEIEAARLKVIEMQMRFLPHCNVPVTVTRDGSRWVCMFESDPDPMKCVVAYGASPAQACSNFDALWNGAEGFLIEDEDELEEEF